MSRHVSTLATWGLALAIACFAGSGGAQTAPREDSCLSCHSDPDFMVTDKKLYDYYQSWRASLHGLADMTCVDCHGGDRRVPTKLGAHGRAIESSVSFQNVPETCGACHGDYLQAYRKSEHFAHLQRTESVAQGPNCVTCHGSLNAQRLEVTTVREACQRCHNRVSGNHPEIPGQAEALLNDLNAIRGYRRYIGLRADPEEAVLIGSVMDTQIGALASAWHSFELDAIRGATQTLLSYAQEQRDRVKAGRTDQD